MAGGFEWIDHTHSPRKQKARLSAVIIAGRPEFHNVYGKSPFFQLFEAVCALVGIKRMRITLHPICCRDDFTQAFTRLPKFVGPMYREMFETVNLHAAEKLDARTGNQVEVLREGANRNYAEGLSLLTLAALRLRIAREMASSSTPLNAVQLPDGSAMQKLMGELNGSPGPKVVPGRTVPVPDSVSAALQHAISMPYRNDEWLLDAPDAAGWRAAVANLAEQATPSIDKIVGKLGVKVEATTIAGVSAFIVTPPSIPEKNANRLVVNTHGGGYIFNPGRASLLEPAVIAATCGVKVIEVDYRMPPDHPFPAASDDAFAVWKAALEMVPAANIAITGGSAGGGLALSTVLRCMQEGVTLPAAVAVQTPWCDLAPVGDSLKVHEWIDNILITYDAVGSRGAKLYAAGQDIANPLLSPLHGNFEGFPPTMLVSGTRDLILSQTVLLHCKLRQAGVTADLHLMEGGSHFTYFIEPFAPESQHIFAQMSLFLDKHLGN